MKLQSEYFQWEHASPQQEERLHLYLTNLERVNSPPSWCVLAPSRALIEWQDVIQNELGVNDSNAVTAMKDLLPKPFGPYEMNRMFAHLLKDSSSSSRTSKPDEGWKRSKWMASSCNESIRALKNWSEWDCQEQWKKGLEYKPFDGPHGKLTWHWVPKDSGYSSTSSSNKRDHQGWR